MESMRKIWKYRIQEAFSESARGHISLAMPCNAIVVKADMQDGIACLWAEVLEGNPEEARHFRIYGTGHQINPRDVYVCTFQMGFYVWHVYEVK